MGRYSVLWNVIPVYGPSSGSMERYTCLWAVIRFYGTLYLSMGRPPVLWNVLTVYGPLFSSMERLYQSIGCHPNIDQFFRIYKCPRNILRHYLFSLLNYLFTTHIRLESLWY